MIFTRGFSHLMLERTTATDLTRAAGVDLCEAGGRAPIIRIGYRQRSGASHRGVRIPRWRPDRARSVPGPLDGPVDFAHQNGDRTIADLDTSYNAAADGDPSTVSGMSSKDPRPRVFPIGKGMVSGVTLNDKRAVAKKAILGIHQINPADKESRQFMLKSIRDDGMSDNIILPVSLSEYGPAKFAIQTCK